ncbi:hypothetical protein GCM10027262_61240 [Nocardia tengchongensis]
MSPPSDNNTRLATTKTVVALAISNVSDSMRHADLLLRLVLDVEFETVQEHRSFDCGPFAHSADRNVPSPI